MPVRRSQRGAIAFDSPIGRCILAWTEEGVKEFHLPDPGERLRRGRGKKSAPRPESSAVVEVAERLRPVSHLGAAPAWVRSLVKRIRKHLGGDLDDFLDVPIEAPEDASSFELDVWDTAREVPPGFTITYGELADEVGRPGAARAVGNAMRRTPVSLLIPAHRVIAAGRRPGGWTGPGGVATKMRLLALEGVEFE